jgi:hypothetical protein
MFFLLFLLDAGSILIRSRIHIRISELDPYPGGPKTYGSYGSGCREAAFLPNLCVKCSH